jgi:hypothetical protein
MSRNHRASDTQRKRAPLSRATPFSIRSEPRLLGGFSRSGSGSVSGRSSSGVGGTGSGVGGTGSGVGGTGSGVGSAFSGGIGGGGSVSHRGIGGGVGSFLGLLRAGGEGQSGAGNSGENDLAHI